MDTITDDDLAAFEPTLTKNAWAISGVKSTSAFGIAYERQIVPELLKFLKPRSKSVTIVAFNVFERVEGREVNTPTVFIGIDRPNVLRTKESEDKLRMICGGNAWPEPAIGIFDVRQGGEVESSAIYSDMNDIDEVLEGWYAPAGRNATLLDEQLFHEHIALSASIGASPEIKDKPSSSSHGFFLQECDSGYVYGISAAHGFKGDTKKRPELVDHALTSPSFVDLKRAEKVLMQVVPGFQQRELSLRKTSQADPRNRNAASDYRIAKKRMDQLKKLQSKTAELLVDHSLATFAKLQFGRYEAAPATDVRGQTRQDRKYYEVLDYVLYRLTNKSRFDGNFALATPSSKFFSVADLQLDAKVAMNSRILGETQGVISGIALYEYTKKDSEEDKKGDDSQQDELEDDKEDFYGKTMRHWFVTVDPTMVEDALKNQEGVILSAPGASGGIWRNKSERRALALHRAGRKIPAPAIFLDSKNRKIILDKIDRQRYHGSDNEREGEVDWVKFPKWSGKYFCEIAMVENLQTILRHAAANGIKLEHLDYMD